MSERLLPQYNYTAIRVTKASHLQVPHKMVICGEGKKKTTKPGEFHHGLCSPVSSLGASHLSSLFSFSPSPLSVSSAPPWRCLDNKSQRMPLSFHCLCFPQPPLACHYITHPHTSIHTVRTHAHTNKRTLTNIQRPWHTLVYQVVTELHFD